jgi:hypothetical protein
MTETDYVIENFDTFSELTRSFSRNFIKFSRLENFTFYVVCSLQKSDNAQYITVTPSRTKLNGNMNQSKYAHP